MDSFELIVLFWNLYYVLSFMGMECSKINK